MTEEEKEDALSGTYDDFTTFLDDAKATAELIPKFFTYEYWDELYVNFDWNYVLSGKFLEMFNTDQWRAVVLFVGGVSAIIGYLVLTNWVINFDMFVDPTLAAANQSNESA